MPVTAKLSRAFYERFGDEIANEIVNWFNAVDETYRADLRELNELNFARFDAKLEQRLAEVKGEFVAQMSGLRADLTGLIAQEHAVTLKWMFALWMTTMLGMAGLYLR